MFFGVLMFSGELIFLGVFILFGVMSPMGILGNSIRLGESLDFFDVSVEGDNGSLLSFGRLGTNVDISGESAGRSMGFLGAFNACGAGIMFSLSLGTERVFFGSDIFRRGVSGRFNAGLGSVDFFGVSFRTGFFSTGFFGTRSVNFGRNPVSSFCSTGLGLLIGAGFEGSCAKRTPIFARMGGGTGTHISEIAPIVIPSTI